MTLDITHTDDKNFVETPSWKRLSNSIKSPFTVRYYTRCMRCFIQITGETDIQRFVNSDRKYVEQVIIDYINVRQNMQKVRPQSVAVDLAMLKHLFVYNDRTDINWKVIKGYLGERIRAVKDKAYSLEQLQLMWTYADLRGKVILLLMATSGMRVGGLDGLKVGSLKEVKEQGIYAITVYERTPDEYVTYCTPECKVAIDAYLNFRMRSGEPVSDDSPVLRDLFNPYNPERVCNPGPLRRDGIATIMFNIAARAGLRGRSHDRRTRNDIMLNHGLRKFFFKACGKANINPIARELLMGHKVGNLQNGVNQLMMVYDATEQSELLDAFLKCIPFLTVSNEERIKQEMKVKEQENSRLHSNVAEFSSVIKQLREQGVLK